MKSKHWLWFILVLALFLRWWQLEEWFHFTMDEELIAWRAWGLFELKRPFLIGGISPLQIHLPPYFYYFSALLLWPFQFDPIGWGWWAGIFSLVTIYWLYRYSRSLTATLLYTVSWAVVAFDHHYWPLFFNPLFTLLLLWFLKQKNNLGLILTLVLAVTADPSNLTLGLFVLLYRPRALKYWWLGAGIFLAPLLAFDLRHNWQNLAGIGRLLTNVAGKEPNWQALLLLPQSLSRFWYTAQTNLIEIYSYCIPYAQARLAVNPWLLIAAIVVTLLSWKQREIRLLLIAYFIGIGLFGLMGFSLFDHYLTGLMPVWAMATALVIKRLPKLFGTAVIIVFLAVNLYQFSRATNPYGLTNKKELIKWANQYLAGSNWDLESESKCHRENGLRYLFELSGNPPAKSFMDDNFSWLYPQPSIEGTVDKILLVTDRQESSGFEVQAEKTFGAITGYIFKP
ncbi:hypothetical protein COX09_00555 [Candidatus Beckwithbacteria bacterium CG23_combo_of_CG06-09_8_20_14_all_47_9]|uniref:Glycosyltransferase RgtA/B/C/D-like domain-containing protein n=1 Tax=Candidatus Beckwithbacteria bacterium CG23_combo_of_CG06-09_8_20_14_all_47_9 TaxID=1974498 RepID=A0A2H0B4Q0_9BACT|nr:MAG: hypothetical protein COX09_00555 [Candidatus Beckwithbacteria bacterium CG23_combo_of_CG06-09_8_20_14_all_47_9]